MRSKFRTRPSLRAVCLNIKLIPPTFNRCHCDKYMRHYKYLPIIVVDSIRLIATTAVAAVSVVKVTLKRDPTMTSTMTLNSWQAGMPKTTKHCKIVVVIHRLGTGDFSDFCGHTAASALCVISCYLFISSYDVINNSIAYLLSLYLSSYFITGQSLTLQQFHTHSQHSLRMRADLSSELWDGATTRRMQFMRVIHFNATDCMIITIRNPVIYISISNKV